VVLDYGHGPSTVEPRCGGILGAMRRQGNNDVADRPPFSIRDALTTSLNSTTVRPVIVGQGLSSYAAQGRSSLYEAFSSIEPSMHVFVFLLHLHGPPRAYSLLLASRIQPCWTPVGLIESGLRVPPAGTCMAYSGH
jgi:hypothetical protein